MALHPDFPASPYAIPLPDQRWFPAPEDLRDKAYENLLPPLVARIREQVSDWRDADYVGASATSKALLRWWLAVATAACAGGSGTRYQFVYVDQQGFEQHRPNSTVALTASFREYQPGTVDA